MSTRGPVCPACGVANASDSTFCTYCGSKMPVAGPAQEETRSIPSSPTLTDDIREIRTELARLDQRMMVLEQLQGIRMPAASAPEPIARPATETIIPSLGVEPGGTGIADVRPTETLAWQEPLVVASSPREASPADGGSRQLFEGPSAPGPGEPPSPSFWGFSLDWERILGRNWLAIVGALALAIGMGFFLALAIEKQWIGPREQVGLGMVTGLALLGAGWYTQRRYPIWAQAVTGGGIGILYLSIYAAMGFYHLIPPLAAFIFLGAVVALSGLLALRHGSLVIALLGIFVAFLTPILLRRALDPELRFLLLLYIIFVDAGILGVSTFRNWRWFTLVGLVASYLLLWGSLGGISPAERVGAEVAVTGVFLIFVGATTLFHVLWRRAPAGFDLTLMTLNVAAYFGLTFALLWADYRAWFGLIGLSLTLFYTGVGYVAVRRSGTPSQVPFFCLGTALVFLTLTMPLQFTGHLITVAWAIEAAAVVWLGFFFRSQPTRTFALGVFGLAAIRLVALDTLLDSDSFRLLTNVRFPTFAVAVAALYVAAWLYAKGHESLQEWERPVSLLLAVAANLFTLWMLSAEAIDYFDSLRVSRDYSSQEAENGKWLSLTGLWALYAAGLLAVAWWRRSLPLRLGGVGVLAASATLLLLMDTLLVQLDPATFLPGLNVRFLIFLVVLLVTAFAAWTYSRQRQELATVERGIFPGMVGAANLIAIWMLSAEALTHFDSLRLTGTLSWQGAMNGKLLSLTGLWAVYAFGLLAVALLRRSRELRWGGVGVLAASAAMLLFVDTFKVQLDPATFLPGLNVRFLVFLMVLPVTAFAAYVYWRQRNGMSLDERWVFPTLVASANFMALWVLSGEVITYFNAVEALRGGAQTSAKHLSLTVLWAVYAIGIIGAGIIRHYRIVRVAGMAVLAVPVVKLFVVDIFLLQRGYRVAAFLTLGVLLLATGLAYQRHSGAVKGFLFGKPS